MYSFVQSQRATTHTLQNVSEVNRERSRLAAASSVCDSAKHNGLVTRAFQYSDHDCIFIFAQTIRGRVFKFTRLDNLQSARNSCRRQICITRSLHVHRLQFTNFKSRVGETSCGLDSLARGSGCTF